MSTPTHRPRSDERTSVADARTTATDGAPHAPSASDEAKVERLILSVDEIVALHMGDWVLMRVTAVEGGLPSQGEVIAHDPSRSTIMDLWADVLRSTKPEDRYYVFRARHYIRTGTELREALEVLQQTWDGEIERAW